jgi:hypothetical protein
MFCRYFMGIYIHFEPRELNGRRRTEGCPGEQFPSHTHHSKMGRTNSASLCLDPTNSPLPTGSPSLRLLVCNCRIYLATNLVRILRGSSTVEPTADATQSSIHTIYIHHCSGRFLVSPSLFHFLSSAFIEYGSSISSSGPQWDHHQSSRSNGHFFSDESIGQRKPTGMYSISTLLSSAHSLVLSHRSLCYVHDYRAANFLLLDPIPVTQMSPSSKSRKKLKA